MVQLQVSAFLAGIRAAAFQYLHGAITGKTGKKGKYKQYIFQYLHGAITGTSFKQQ